MQKNWFCSFQQEKFLSLCSISNHSFIIIQRLSQCFPYPESPGLPIWCSLPGSPTRWSVSSSTHWGRFLPGDRPWDLTLSCGHPWWVGPSLQWVQLGLSHLESQNTSPKENPEYHQVACLLIRLRVPSLQPDQATRLVPQGAGVVGILLGPSEMLQKPVLKKPSTTLGELENSGLLHQRAQRS